MVDFGRRKTTENHGGGLETQKYCGGNRIENDSGGHQMKNDHSGIQNSNVLCGLLFIIHKEVNNEDLDLQTGVLRLIVYDNNHDCGFGYDMESDGFIESLDVSLVSYFNFVLGMLVT